MLVEGDLLSTSIFGGDMFKIEDGTFRRPDRVVVKEHFVTHESSEEDIARLILRLKELLNGRSSKIAFEMMEEGVRQVLKEKKAWFLYNHKEGSYVHIYWLLRMLESPDSLNMIS